MAEYRRFIPIGNKKEMNIFENLIEEKNLSRRDLIVILKAIKLNPNAGLAINKDFEDCFKAMMAESKGSTNSDSEQMNSLNVDLSKDELIINGKTVKDRPVIVTLPGPDGWPVCKLYNPKLATGKQEECDKLTVTYKPSRKERK